MEAGANENAIEAWNTVLFDKFTRFRRVLTVGLSGHGDGALARHAPPPGARVLDLGCGFGDMTQQLATHVGPGGEAVGVDAAVRFIESARREAIEAGVKNARFFAADVQSADLDGPYDRAYSRFGTMFFASPVQALRNVRASLAKGGRLCMVVWRKREDNACMHAAERVVKAMLPEPEKTDQVTCGPGPFSMADADTVSAQLLKAGFHGVTFERHDVPICIGYDMDEALEFAMALGPAGEAVRLAGDEGERRRPEVLAALRETLAQFQTPDGIVAPSSAWIVTAHA